MRPNNTTGGYERALFMRYGLLASVNSCLLFVIVCGDDALADPDQRFTIERMRGQVVWLADVLKAHQGVTVARSAHQNVLALVTEDEHVWPLIEDVRGRSFRRDKRLRDMQVELHVRRYKDVSAVQVLKILQIKDGLKFIVDYWCDVCAIGMFEHGPCDCCQDINRLRKRLAVEP